MLTPLKYAIKLCTAYILFYSGILHLYKRILLNNNAVVLMYHRVLSDEETSDSFSHEGIIVNEEIFDMHLDFLKKHFNVLPVNEFASHMTTKSKFKRHSCLITFDDGWSDNYKNAFPIIKRHAVPALIFLPTDYIGTNTKFWQEQLSELLFILAENKVTDHPALKKLGYDNSKPIDKLKLRHKIQKFVSHKKNDSKESIERLISELSALVKQQTSEFSPNNIDTYMSWNEIIEMSKEGISFGSHAVSHHILTNLGTEEIEYELQHSKNVISDKLSKTINSLAYPNGNFNKDILQIADKNDYEVAFSTKPGVVACDDNSYSIKRVNIHSGITKNTPMFFCRILGIF